MNAMPPSVLIVDNDTGLLMAVSVRIESMGCRCVRAQSGAQGLAELRHNDFDLLITDLNMPLGDGLALATAFRRCSEAPIVVITGFVGEYAVGLEGIDNLTVIEKPFETHRIVGLISELIPYADFEALQ